MAKRVKPHQFGVYPTQKEAQSTVKELRDKKFRAGWTKNERDRFEVWILGTKRGFRMT